MKKLLIIVFVSIFTACSEDKSEQLLHESYLQKGWKLTFMSINNAEVDLSVIPFYELMYLTDQQLCYLAIPENNGVDWVYSDVRTAWNYDYKNNILNIASALPVTYYIDKIEDDNLELHYYIYNTGGEIDLYKKVFQSVEIQVKDLTIRLVD